MPTTGVTIRRNALESIPAEYLKLALEENPTAWGCSIVTPEGIDINSGDGIDLEQIEETIANFNERNIVLYLCNSESAINMDDVCPYNIVEDDAGKPQIIAYVTGEFSGYKRMESTRPTSFHFYEEYLKPKIEGLWEMVDGDLDKVMTAIEKPLFKKELLKDSTTSATITLLASNGKVLTFAQGEGPSEYKWGWVSNNYGYAVAMQPDKPAKKSMFPNKSTVREKAVPTQAVAAPATGATAAASTYTVMKWKPKATDSRKDRKAGYQLRIGYCPIGWDRDDKNYVEIECFLDPKTKQMVPYHQAKRLGLEAVGVPKLNNPPRAEGKDIEADNVAGNQRQTGPAVTVDILPIITPKSREAAKDILRREDVKKLIAENGDAVSDPSRIAEEEKKIEGFSVQLGSKTAMMDFSTICFVSFEAQQKWQQTDPNSYNVFVRSLINYYLATEANKKAKLTGEEVHVAAKEELKPQKKSLFPQKKVA